MKKLILLISVSLMLSSFIFAAPEGPVPGGQNPSGSTASSPGSVPPGGGVNGAQVPQKQDNYDPNLNPDKNPSEKPKDRMVPPDNSQMPDANQNYVNFRGTRKAVVNLDIEVTEFYCKTLKNGDEEIHIYFNQRINPSQFDKSCILIDEEMPPEDCKISFNKNSDMVKILISKGSVEQVNTVTLLNVCSLDGKKVKDFVLKNR